MKTRTPPHLEHTVSIATGQGFITGLLRIPNHSRGLVLVPEGEKSNRSNRSRKAVREFNRSKFATLLLHLLTLEESAIDAQNSHFRFDIPLLSDRLIEAVQWLKANPDTRDFKIGCYPVGTAVAAALAGAAEHPELVQAIVASDGRPDLGGKALKKLRTPTLFLLDARDAAGIEANRRAAAHLREDEDIETICGDFPPDAVEDNDQLLKLAVEWFGRHLIQDKRVKPPLSRGR